MLSINLASSQSFLSHLSLCHIFSWCQRFDTVLFPLFNRLCSLHSAISSFSFKHSKHTIWNTFFHYFPHNFCVMAQMFHWQLWFLFIFMQMKSLFLKIVFEGGFARAKINFSLITSIVWCCFSFASHISSEAFLF